MAERFHDICYLVEREGEIAPAHRSSQAIETEALAGRDLEIHVFRAPGEATAFAAGVAVLASNRLRVRVGIGPVAHVAVLERLDTEGPGRVGLVDHGGARVQQAATRWAWLTRLARTWDRRGHRWPTVMFQPPHGDAPAELKIEHHRFRVAEDGETVRLMCPIPADPEAVRAHLAATLAPWPEGLVVGPSELNLSLPKTALADEIKTLHAIAQGLAHCRYQRERAEKRAETRQDRSHCRVVELMLQGWTLTNSQGRGDLKPPAGSGLKMRVLSYAMLDRLIDVGLIRPPPGREIRGHKQWGAVYEVGDLTGTAVRRPEDGAPAPKARSRRSP